MSSTRGYALSLVLGLLGAVAVTVGVTRPWASATARQAGNPLLEASASGAELAPLAGALGIVMLAALGAVVATRAVVRRVVGAVIVVAALVVVVSAARPDSAGRQLEAGLSAVGWAGGDYSTATEPWRWISLVGAVACLAAGALVVWFGGQWASMGARYDAPVPSDTDASVQRPRGSESDELSEAEAWRALDEGRDPTRQP